MAGVVVPMLAVATLTAGVVTPMAMAMAECVAFCLCAGLRWLDIYMALI